MQQLDIHTWHSMPAFLSAYTKIYAMVFSITRNIVSNMDRCKEMNIKQVKIII